MQNLRKSLETQRPREKGNRVQCILNYLSNKKQQQKVRKKRKAVRLYFFSTFFTSIF